MHNFIFKNCLSFSLSYILSFVGLSIVQTFWQCFPFLQNLILFVWYSIENIKDVREVFWICDWWNELKWRYQIIREFVFLFCYCCFWRKYLMKAEICELWNVDGGEKWTQKCARKNCWRMVAWRTWCMGM